MTDALGFLWGGEAALPPEHITTRGEVLICSCFANSASRELLPVLPATAGEETGMWSCFQHWKWHTGGNRSTAVVVPALV